MKKSTALREPYFFIAPRLFESDKKMKNWYFGAFTISVVLTGCYSFNRITIPDAQLRDQRLANKVVLELAGELAKNGLQPSKSNPTAQNAPHAKEITCGVYVMPALPKTPELPFEQLRTANKNDAAALDEIQRQHISDLRNYIIKSKIELQKSYNEYLHRCYGGAGFPAPGTGN